MNKRFFRLKKREWFLPFIAKKWVSDGCPSPAPQIIKIHQILAAIKKYRLKNFVETGTHYADTTEFVAKTGAKCWSIELSEDLYKLALKRMKAYKNVTLLQGDSGKEITKVLESLSEPAFFWLDGHYSGNETALGDKVSPVSEEIQAILKHPVKEHVIFIDDARLFDGSDYPGMADFLSELSNYSDYKVKIECDSIRIYPQHRKV